MTGVSMRTVPRRLTLNPAYPKCSTKEGKSFAVATSGDCGHTPVSGNHSTARPSLPAIDVNVPHSCAIRSGSPGRLCDDATNARARLPANRHARKIRTTVFGFILLTSRFCWSGSRQQFVFHQETVGRDSARATDRLWRPPLPFAHVPGA